PAAARLRLRDGTFRGRAPVGRARYLDVTGHVCAPRMLMQDRGASTPTARQPIMEEGHDGRGAQLAATQHARSAATMLRLSHPATPQKEPQAPYYSDMGSDA